MRTWSRREILLGGVGSLLAACTQGRVGYSVIVSGEGNQVSIVQATPGDGIEDGAFIATIRSESGIGQANIAWWGDTAPHLLYFQLYLSGLEQFTLRWAEVAVNVSVNSIDPGAIQSYQMQQGSETMIAPDSPYWMDVTIPQLVSDSYQLRAPAAFVTTEPRLWSIAWIDFYR